MFIHIVDMVSKQTPSEIMSSTLDMLATTDKHTHNKKTLSKCGMLHELLRG